MTLVRVWAGIDLRRRWRALVVLALLVAIAAAAVLSAAAGARRTESVMDRLLARTLPNDAIVVPNIPGFDWDKVRALPEVTALMTIPLNGPLIEGIPPEDSLEGLMLPADTEAMRTIERPIILEGRLADPDRADEAVVTPRFLDHGYGVGDTIRVRMHLPETTDKSQELPEPPPYDGPRAELRIVGVVRSFWFSDEPGSPGSLLPSQAFFAKYRANVLGATEQVNVNALVRLRDGEASMPKFREDMASIAKHPVDAWSAAEDNARVQQTLNFLALSVLAFGVAALLAAMFLIGQALARYTAGTVSDLMLLRPLGLTPRQAVVTAAVPPTVAGLGGAVLGVAGAFAVSNWMPFGDAAVLEPEPGLSFDWLVLVPGSVIAVLGVAAASAGSAWFALLSSYRPRAARRSMLANTAARFGLPVSLVIGTRFALEPGLDRGSVPVRPAVLGAVTGVMGVLAAFTFSAGVADASDDLRRFGQTYQLGAFVGWEADDFMPVDQAIGRWAADPDVLGVTNARSDVAQIEKTTAVMFSNDTKGTPLDVVMLEGQMPSSANELVLAPTTAEAMGVSVGSVVHLEGRTPTRRTLTVTGIGFVPEAPHNDYSEGGWLTPKGYQALFGDKFKFHQVLFVLRDGADVGAVEKRLEQSANALGDDIAADVTGPTPPMQLQLVRGVRVLPVFLGGFLFVLALGAVGHAVATAVRRRRYEVAVLRALGMTPRQARVVVVTQASVLAVVGLVVGIPLGLALGRALWRVVADIMPLAYIAPIAVLALLLVVPVALLASNLLALWPGRVAAGMRVGQVLRAE